MSVPTDSAVSTFIDEYLQALSKIVENTKKQILETKIKPSFPVEFPVKADVYMIDRQNTFLPSGDRNRPTDS
jgi:hypothetical protein